MNYVETCDKENFKQNTREIDNLDTLIQNEEFIISENPLFKKSITYRGLTKWGLIKMDFHYEVPVISPILGKYISTFVSEKKFTREELKKSGLELKHLGFNSIIINFNQ